MLVSFTHRAIVFVMVVFMASTACAMKTFNEMKDDACKIAREIVGADGVIKKDELFSGVLCSFIKELPQSREAQLFLAKFESFKNDSHWKVKSFQKFLASLIGSRIKPVYECLCDLIKLFPEDYIQKYIFDWLEWSLRSGKQLYFKFFLDEYGCYCKIEDIKTLSGKSPYSGLHPEATNRYEACKILLSDYLNKKLGQEVVPGIDCDMDYDADFDSDSEISDDDTDQRVAEKAAQILSRLSSGLVLVWPILQE